MILDLKGRAEEVSMGQETMLNTICKCNGQYSNCHVIYIHYIRAKYEGGIGMSTGGWLVD